MVGIVSFLNCLVAIEFSSNNLNDERLHTFQQLASTDPCDPREESYNDFVEDTPIQNGPSSRIIQDCTIYLGGKKELPDSCPDLPGQDALFNYVNYPGHEECLAQEGSFTCGQIERMYRHWMLFRFVIIYVYLGNSTVYLMNLTFCNTIEGIEQRIVKILMTWKLKLCLFWYEKRSAALFPNPMMAIVSRGLCVMYAMQDTFYASQNQVQLIAEDGEQHSIIFDSIKDHWVAHLVAKRQRMFLVDACVRVLRS